MPELVTVRRYLAALAAVVLASGPITTAAAPVVVAFTRSWLLCRPSTVLP